MNRQRIAILLAAIFMAVVAVVVSLAVLVGGLQLAYNLMLVVGFTDFTAGLVILGTVITIILTVISLIAGYSTQMDAWIERNLKK